MLAKNDAISALVETWLVDFERALAGTGEAALRALFRPDCHWRDVLALTWAIQTLDGRDAALGALKTAAVRARPQGFRIDPDRTPPRRVTRAGQDCIEAFLQFETGQGVCNGVVRLVEAGGAPKGWTLLTALDQIKGHAEQSGRTRFQDKVYARDFRGPNWLDQRKTSAAYADRDPAVLVVGGGQAGLSIAARLAQLNVDTLIVDRGARIGDNWRKRYHALVLHNQAHVNHLPYMPFPPTWPSYIPKDKVANWFESYAESMELNFWTGTEFLGGDYDESARRWIIALRRADGTRRTMRPRHVVLATGASGIPIVPDIPSLKKFRGTVMHASEYVDGEAWRGKAALILGTGTSGHDIAQDLHSAGAKPTLAQRGTTMVVQVEPSAQLPYALYDEGPPTDDCDLITVSVPLALSRKSHIALTEQARMLDLPLLDALEKKGFRLDFGDDGAGWQFKYLTRGGGYYFNVGCSDLIVKGEVGLIQYSDIAEFAADGARMKSGETLKADLVVLATGYRGQEAEVAQLFGEAVAARVGPIWGFGEGNELRNMFVRTKQPGLWFIAGSFAQCRIYSKYLALQIKAGEAGLMPAAQGSA
ncbi:MAG: NAD(P)/FAD-dependent oxidoreductase [Alphaproteobacteria bacterium]|nr:NAD(P)/FAD-dependent oxidoreductase [Alphaproteobacteria bacterium]